MSKFSYRDAGVDVEAGDSLVDWLVESDGKPQGANGSGDGSPVKSASPRADQVVSGI
ncbi:hypothetical protein Q9L58_010986, partial [Maublancomyces gigas]